MKRIIATAAILLLTFFSLSAYAMNHYLTKMWTTPKGTMCEYDNGTIINAGTGGCPPTIKD